MLVGRWVNDGVSCIISSPVSNKMYSVNSQHLYQFGFILLCKDLVNFSCFTFIQGLEYNYVDDNPVSKGNKQ